MKNCKSVVCGLLAVAVVALVSVPAQAESRAEYRSGAQVFYDSVTGWTNLTMGATGGITRIMLGTSYLTSSGAQIDAVVATGTGSVPAAYMIVGNADGRAVAVPITGDWSVSTSGVVTVTQSAGAFHVIGNANVTGTLTSTGAVHAIGAATFDSTAIVQGTLTASNGFTVTGGTITLPATFNLASANSTNFIQGMFRSGSCTNGQTISFSPAFGSTPIVTGVYLGLPVTNSLGVYGDIYLQSVGTSSFVLNSTVQCTNPIYWTAVNVP